MYTLVNYLSFFARLLRLYQIIINSTLYFELEFKKKTASNRSNITPIIIFALPLRIKMSRKSINT